MCLHRLKEALKQQHPGRSYKEYKKDVRKMLAELEDDETTRKVYYNVFLNTLHDALLRGQATRLTFKPDIHGIPLMQKIFKKLAADGLLFAELLFLRIYSREGAAIDAVLKTLLPNW